ncbi:ROK family protein [Cohnella sp. GbtcB17]|uniref:ROK family protein n=1 Tax=Cohnella sp. GbtcB17 TaxID=2824762 RepID=UPI001C2F2317
MTRLVAGLDIGGTKCAVSLGLLDDEGEVASIVAKRQFATPDAAREALAELADTLEDALRRTDVAGPLAAVGISCGGPLDSARGLLLSPPNLVGWGTVDVVGPFAARFGVPVGLQNDANACAVAEWRWGAGRGTRHMIFLTFGTGMGAGLILNGRLYAGANDMAGEIGHVTMETHGPAGYGKVGSFEGFCSGGGIAELARGYALAALQAGEPLSFCRSYEALGAITARLVGEAAMQGDAAAAEIMRVSGEQLGRGLAILVDVLNPERIVIGSIYGRQRSLLEPAALDALAGRALKRSLQACEIVPAQLGELAGDYGALAVARMALEEKEGL